MNVKKRNNTTEKFDIEKINKVINAMRNDGFEITKELANLMGQKVLLKSEKFRINKKTKLKFR